MHKYLFSELVSDVIYAHKAAMITHHRISPTDRTNVSDGPCDHIACPCCEKHGLHLQDKRANSPFPADTSSLIKELLKFDLVSVLEAESFAGEPIGCGVEGPH